MQITDQLKSANASLKKQDQLKDDFLNAVAHELKTPITSIKASSEVLQDDDEMPIDLKKKFLNNIIFDTQRVANLVNDMLDLEKLASGRRKLELIEVDLNNLVNRAIDSFQPLADKRKVALCFSADNDKTIAQVDDEKLLQVFTNILSNALKFVNEKEGVIRIEILSVEEKVQIHFTDNGKGVPEADQDYIFDKFYQSANQSLKKAEGSGFGLAICRQIVHLHKGKIWLDKKHHNGAKFIVELPKYQKK